METIKDCRTCGETFTVKIFNIQPEDCKKCAIENDRKWREDNAEKREEMKRRMMAQWDELQKVNTK